MATVPAALPVLPPIVAPIVALADKRLGHQDRVAGANVPKRARARAARRGRRRIVITRSRATMAQDRTAQGRTAQGRGMVQGAMVPGRTASLPIMAVRRGGNFSPAANISRGRPAMGRLNDLPRHRSASATTTPLGRHRTHPKAPSGYMAIMRWQPHWQIRTAGYGACC
jgi:hypothetical protein